MAANMRSYGANARELDWDIEDEARRDSGLGSGGWMPLDGLDDELFAAGPQLRAMPVAAPRTGRRAPSIPLPWRREAAPQVGPTRVHPTRQATQPRTAPQSQTQVQPKQQTTGRTVEARAVGMIALVAVGLASLYAVVSAAVEWTQVKLDDMQYGRPRTMQMQAYVGHNEAEGVPSHFIAMNLNRRVTILEMPGGDSTKVNTIVGPYLFGQGEDLTPVTLNSYDLNADNLADLVVSVKSEQLLYLNDGASFRIATPEERQAIQKAQARSAAPQPNGSAPSVAGEAGK